MLAGDHSTVDEDRLQALVAAVYHRIQHLLTIHHKTSVADPDPGSGIGSFLTPGSGIRDGRKSASGSGIRDPG